MTVLGIGQAVRVVVVDPGWHGWFLVGAMAGWSLAAIVGAIVVFWWHRRIR